MYEYAATVYNIVDGDTFDLQVDLGFYTLLKDRFRLARINAPEMNTDEGKAAKEYAMQFLNQSVTIKTKRNPKDKYGRYLADIYLSDGTCINDKMVQDGHAVYYMA